MLDIQVEMVSRQLDNEGKSLGEKLGLLVTRANNIPISTPIQQTYRFLHLT